jgi:hypothetical protein
LADRHLERRKYEQDIDPLDNPTREVYFRKDGRDNAEKVKDKVVEAGNDTRNANQYVKFLNAHVQDKVSKLERLKAEQRKFEQELDMFKVDPSAPQPSQATENKARDSENILIVNDLSALINKYGFEKLSAALDSILNKKQ